MTLPELATLAMRHNGSIGFADDPSPEGLGIAAQIGQLVLDELAITIIPANKALPLSRLIAFEIAPAFGLEPSGARADFIARLA